MSKQDIMDTFSLEGMLHGFAARRVAEEHTPEQLQELLDRHEEMLSHSDDPRAMANLNWHFHRRINYMAGSRKLLVALKTVALAMPRDLVVEFPEWVPDANAEHALIIDAMRHGDADTVETVMREHVAVGGRTLVHYLESKGVALD
jgi:DNA-binding GntR family transcriptional regulator